jgi:zinc transporter ZupT
VEESNNNSSEGFNLIDFYSDSGDFAVLLKAGMSAKQAVFYNLLSSILCIFGMVFGVLLGATPAASSWMFAAAAGMFIYIALVDMVPAFFIGINYKIYHARSYFYAMKCTL